MAEKVLLSTDIGSDIDDALALLTMFNSGIWKDINEIDINPRERTDDVIVVWR